MFMFLFHYSYLFIGSMRWIKVAERQLFGARKYNRLYRIATIFEHMKLLRVSFMYRWKVYEG